MEIRANIIIAGAQSGAAGVAIINSTAVGTQHDFAPAGFASAGIVLLNPASALTITGWAAPAPAHAKPLLVINTGSGFAATLTSEDTGSSAANRMALNGTMLIPPQCAAQLVYDPGAARWRAVSDAGSSIDDLTEEVAVDAANDFVPFWDASAGATAKGRVSAIANAVRSPASPIVLMDDFLFGSTETGEVGELNWSFVSGTVTPISPPAGAMGVIARITGTAANTVAWMTPLSDGAAAICTFANCDEATFRVALAATTANFTIRFGFANSGAANPPTQGAYFERLSTDTDWFGVARASSVQARTAALLAQDTAYHTFRVRRINATTVGFTVDGGAEVTLNSNVPSGTVGVQPFLHIIPTTTTSRQVDIDFIRVALTPPAR